MQFLFNLYSKSRLIKVYLYYFLLYLDFGITCTLYPANVTMFGVSKGNTVNISEVLVVVHFIEDGSINILLIIFRMIQFYLL